MPFDITTQMRRYLESEGWQEHPPGPAGCMWEKDSRRIGVVHKVIDGSTELDAIVDRLASAEERTPDQVLLDIRSMGAQPSESIAHADAVACLLYELGTLKHVRRAGWWQAGVRDPESVAEHSCRVGQIAGILATMEGCDPARASLLGLWHDSGETRTMDIPWTAKRYLSLADETQIVDDQTAALPDAPANFIVRAVDEFEDGVTLEAQCARDADRLECVYQACEYQNQGYQGVGKWLTSCFEALKLPSAQALGEAALRVTPQQWGAGG